MFKLLCTNTTFKLHVLSQLVVGYFCEPLRWVGGGLGSFSLYLLLKHKETIKIQRHSNYLAYKIKRYFASDKKSPNIRSLISIDLVHKCFAA